MARRQISDLPLRGDAPTPDDLVAMRNTALGIDERVPVTRFMAEQSEDSVADIRSRSVTNLIDGSIVSLAPTSGDGGFFRFDESSTATDDGETVIKPDSIDSADPGRWLAYFPRFTLGRSASQVSTNADRNIADVTELRGIDPSAETLDASTAVNLLGYNDPGDGGGGTLRWDSSDLSTEVASDPQGGVYIAPDSDATGASGAWVRLYSGLLNARWFGAHPTASASENTTAIQAALDLSDDPKEVYLPAGYYDINDTLTITGGNITDSSQTSFVFVGDGRRATRITQTDTSKDVFYIERGNGNASGWMWGTLRGIGIRYESGVKADPSAAIRHRRCLNVLFEDLVIEGANRVSVSEGSAQCRYSNIFSRGTFRSEAAETVYTFTVNGDTNRSFGNYMNNCEHQAGETYDRTFLIEGSDGLYVTNCHFNHSLEKIVIEPQGGAFSDHVFQTFFNNVYFDGNGGPVRHINIRSVGSGSNRIEGLYFDNCFFRVASAEMFIVSKGQLTGVDTIREIKFTGCEAKQIEGALFSSVGATPGDNLNIVSNISLVGNTFHDGLPDRTDANVTGFGFEGKNIVFADNIIQGKWTDAGSVPVNWGYVENGRSNGNLYKTERSEGTNENISGNASGILQDHVTGEFTATLASGATTTPTATLRYIKTGRRVTIFGQLNFGTLDVNGTPLEVSGLPYAASENSSSAAGHLARVDFNSSAVQFWSIGPSDTKIALEEVAPNSGSPTAVNTEASGTYTPTFDELSFTYYTED